MMDPNNLPHHVYLHKDHKYKLKLGFHAAPSNPKAFSKAIRDELNILKFTYCSDLNGLIMGFGKISSNKLIPADIRHCISVVVNVDVYIFRPPVGSIIEAIVNQTSDNHVSCLVHNLFNVSIVRPENEPYDQWSGSKIKKDDKIDVKVLSFDLTKKLPHITGEIIKKKDDKCYDSTDIQDSSTKSSSSKNIVSDFTKSFNRNTASPSKSSSSDSEITEMTNITMPKISADKSIKTSPLSINTTMKHSEKVDLTVNSSKLSSSDSESSDEMINIMTSSAICDDKPVPSVTTNTIIQQEDTAESAPELSDSDSEFSSKIKAMLSTFKEEDKSKSTKTASHIRNSINNKHIESPLFSSTPILNSEHSVNNINLIRNKQKEQLKKHLAKNSTEKQKSLVSDKGSNQFDKDKLSQSLNILKNNNNNDNSLKVFADSVNSNKNLVIDSKVIQNISRESGSNINDSELEQKSISDNNSFSKKLGKSTKKTKKHKKSNVIVNAILNSINTNKSNANISKHLVDSNNRCIEDDKEENTVYTQHKHNLESKILDEEILNNCKNSNEQAVKNSLTLSLSTKNIKKKDTPQKKDTDNSKNQIKDKKLKKSLNSALSIISDSDSNCSRDLKLAVKDLNLTTDFNENIENETSSSDDEIYSKLKQNISKTQINTNHLNEKPKNQSLPNNKVHTSSDESDSSSKLFFKTPKISSKLIKSNKTKNDSVNMSEPDSCKKSNDNNLLSNEKIIKKDKKRKNVNEKPVHPRLSEKIVDKMDIINHILDNDSNSDNEKVKALKYKTSEEKRVEVKNSRKKPTLNVSKTNTEVSNPFLKVYTTNVTNTSADEETVDINLTKSKKKSSGKKDIIPLVNDDSSSDSEEVTALKHKTSDEKQIDAKNSRKKSTLNVSKTNTEVSNPFLKVYTTNVTNTSADEETVDINLTKSKKKSSGKKDIIPLVNDDSSSDSEEVTALKHKTSDEKQIDAKNSRKKSTLNVSKINTEVSNPFLKVYTTNVTNTSADEETVDINLTKSKKKSSGKKDIISLVNDDSSSDNEEVTALKNKTSDEKQIDAKNSRKKSTLNVSKTNTEVSNPFLKVYTTNVTNTSADEETVDINLTKLKKKSSGKKDIISLVNDDSSSDNEEVTALKNKTSDEKQIDAKNSRKKSTLNVSKTNKDNGVLNKEISNPFLKVYTPNLTNSSSDEETVDINLTKSKKQSSGKKDIIPLVNDDSSSDNEEVTALKNKTSDEKQIDAKNSRKKPTLNESKTNKDNGVLNKEISNPFLKVYTPNLTNSSSDEETVDINLTKSKKQSPGKKDIIPLANDEKKKNILINQLLASIKRKNKNEKLSVSRTNLNTSKSNNKLLKNDKLKKDKSLLNTKNKKDVLNNLNVSIGKPNLDRPNLNCQKVNLSQLNTHLSSYDSTDDEKDFIKKILKKRKFKKTKNAELLEQTMNSNIPTELNKQNEIKEKLHKKSKSQKLSMTAEVKNDDVKKKKKKDTKDFFLNSIISALDDSLIDHPPSKKKKKDHSLNIEPYDSKDKNSDGNLSEVKIKKKKNSKHKDVNLNDATLKDKKKESETLLDSVSKNIQANEDNTLVKVTKKKKKSNPVISESQSITTDKQSKINNKLVDKNVRNFKNTVSSKKKTKKLLENQLKSFMETQDTAHLNSLYNFLSAHLNDKS